MNLKKRQIKDRLVKASYMAFIMHRDVNEHLGKQITYTVENMLYFMDFYNMEVQNNKSKIRLTHNKYGLEVRTLGEFIFLEGEELEQVLYDIEKLINMNIKEAMRSGGRGVDVFDLDLLLPIERHGITTMGDTYCGYNNRKYTVNFLHLYSIINGY